MASESSRPFKTPREVAELYAVSDLRTLTDVERERLFATARLAFERAPSEGRLEEVVQLKRRIAELEAWRDGRAAVEAEHEAERALAREVRRLVFATNMNQPVLAALPSPVSDEPPRKVEIQDALDLLRELEEGNEAEMVTACNGFLESFAARRHKEAP